jgi:glutamate racemase
VIACNTATTNAVLVLRKTFDIPIIGIEPAVKPAALLTTTKSIGILATKGTLSSILFSKTSSEFTKDVDVQEVVGKGLVALIENGEIESAEMTRLLQKYTEPMMEANIDYLVLGCTHYLYLIPQLKKILPSNVRILDSGLAVARHSQTTLASLDLLRKKTTKPGLRFYSNSDTTTLKFLLNAYSEEISVEKKDF